MKRQYMILILLATVWTSFVGQTVDMQQGNAYYAEGSFDKAIEVYEEILDSGFVSGALFFNLGNAYYKSGELAPAVLNFERAKLYLPNDKDLSYNLEMAQRMVLDKIDKVDVFFLKRWVIKVGSLLSSDKWAYMALSAFFLFVIGLSMYTFGRRTASRRLGFVLGIIMLVIVGVSFGYSNANKKKITQRNGAIVFSATVTVKGSPDDSGTELFILHEGTKVHITDSIGEWNEIVLGDGNVGWLKKDAITKI